MDDVGTVLRSWPWQGLAAHVARIAAGSLPCFPPFPHVSVTFWSHVLVNFWTLTSQFRRQAHKFHLGNFLVII